MIDLCTMHFLVGLRRTIGKIMGYSYVTNTDPSAGAIRDATTGRFSIGALN